MLIRVLTRILGNAYSLEGTEYGRRAIVLFKVGALITQFVLQTSKGVLSLFKGIARRRDGLGFRGRVFVGLW